MHAGLVGCDPDAPLTDGRADPRRRADPLRRRPRESSATRGGERLTWGIVSDRDLMRALDAGDTGVTAARWP